MDGKKMVAAEEKHLIPLDKVNGYDVRPGFYGINGATALREGVNFTVCSLEATAVELLLYHRGEKEPYAIRNNSGMGGGYQPQAPSAPSPSGAAGDGFMNIPDGIDEELPFN